MIDSHKEKILKTVFEESIAFNKLVGIKLLSFEPLKIGLENRYELQGNTWRGFLHGGVIATVLDVAGGIAIAHEIIMQNPDTDLAELGKQMTKVGTIDLRIDYLRPGVGESFVATAELMRHGSRITVVRMKFYNEKESLIAAGTGTYVVG